MPRGGREMAPRLLIPDSPNTEIKRNKWGTRICDHGRQRSQCRPCGGAGFCEHDRRREACKECNPAGAYNTYIHSAKRRCARFEISFGEYQAIVSQACFYCGAHDETNGIDQIQPGEGYTLANCVPCCSICNFMKRDYSAEKFLQQVKRITTFQENKHD